jgi:hypothetical protein
VNTYRDRSLDKICKILSREGELRLTNLERLVLLELLKELPKTTKKQGRGRQIDTLKFFRNYGIEHYVANLEDKRWPTEAAVAHAAKEFGVKRATIYGAKTPRRAPGSAQILEPEEEGRRRPKSK